VHDPNPIYTQLLAERDLVLDDHEEDQSEPQPTS
jgi:hypothetical protein